VLEKAQTMKKITVLSFVLTSIVLCGCNSNTPVDTHPANLAGNWKAEFTTKIRINPLVNVEREANVTVGITTETNGSANFEEIATIQDVRSPQTENITGSWKLADDYLIIERPNGGFVAFRISSQSTNQLTVFARTGETIQFNRIP
jgi:Phr family secreted Rap phosphatase inhibitor